MERLCSANTHGILLLILKVRLSEVYSPMLLFLLSVSVLLNILVLLPYLQDIYRWWYERYFAKPFFNESTQDAIVIEAIIKASMNIKKTRMSQQEHHGLFLDFLSFLKRPRNSDITNNFYTSYLYVGLSQYALSYSNAIITSFLRKKIVSWIDVGQHRLSYEIQRIDQIPIGIIFINLYRITKDSLYFDIAASIYHRTLEFADQETGIIRYNNRLSKNYVDTLGMVVPFLMEYYLLTGEKKAKSCAEKNLKNYYTCGVDKETALPAHGYDIPSGLKIGSANWGRGIGWYLLAMSYLHTELIDEKLLRVIEYLPSTQFPNSSDEFDSSAAIMIAIFKSSLKTNKKLSIDFIKKHVRTNGMIDRCSGDTYNFNSYSSSFGESELCNGLFLLLISKFQTI